MKEFLNGSGFGVPADFEGDTEGLVSCLDLTSVFTQRSRGKGKTSNGRGSRCGRRGNSWER